MPTSGCDAVTSEGTCFKYFTSSGISWVGAKQECETGGYNLAKITSAEEETLTVCHIKIENRLIYQH